MSFSPFFFYPSGLLFPFFAEEEGKYSHILLSVFLPLFELFGFTPLFFCFFKIHAFFSHLFDDVLRLLWSEAYRFFFFFISAEPDVCIDPTLASKTQLEFSLFFFFLCVINGKRGETKRSTETTVAIVSSSLFSYLLSLVCD